jgi:hypothetical protein
MLSLDDTELQIRMRAAVPIPSPRPEINSGTHSQLSRARPDCSIRFQPTPDSTEETDLLKSF